MTNFVPFFVAAMLCDNLLKGVFSQHSVLITISVFTLLALLLLVHFCDNRTISEKLSVFYLILFLFCMICVISTFYTPSIGYYRDKYISLGQSVGAALMPLLLNTRERQQSFVSYFVVMNIFFSIYFMFNFILTVRSLDAVLEYRSLYLAVALNLTICIVLSHAFYSGLKKLSVVNFGLLIAVLSGARASISLAVISIVVLMKKTLKNIVSITLTVAAMSVLVWQVFPDILTSTINRFLALLYAQSGNFAGGRDAQLGDAISYISLEPFSGYGFASYSTIVYGIDERRYPHNAVLEIWFEVGVLGVFLFLIMTLYAILLAKGKETKWLIGILFLSALKSSSFAELEYLFFFMAFALLKDEKSNIGSIRCI